MTIHACRRIPEQLVAEIHAPLADRDSFWIHPAALDGCLQLVVGQLASSRDCLRDLFLPLSIERLRWQRRPGAVFHCVMRPRADYVVANETRVADLVLYDEHGVCAQIDGLVVKRASRMSLERSSSDDLDGWLHAVSWEPVELQPAATMSSEAWWLVGEQVTQLDELRDALQTRKQHVLVHDFATASEQLQTNLAPTNTPQHIVLVTPSSQSVLPSPATPTSHACARLLNLIQGVCRTPGELPRMWLVTRGAQAVQHDSLPLDTPAASHWGFARALAHEHPELHGTCLDLDPRSSAIEWTAMVDELLAASAERQVAYRGGQRFVARLQSLVATLDPKVLASNAGQQRLQITARGSLDQLQLIAADARQPGPGEVRIEIDAAGLNFRDVLNALGRYPGDPGELGMECAGRIRDLGPGVEGLAIGDRVVALAQGSLATSVTVAAALVAKVPPSLTLPEAAAVPVVFPTAELGMRRLANLQRGERVLIHAAAGGVGWAAIEIARSVGAEIYATASRDKWDYLRRQGITNLYDSRSLEIVEGVRRDTMGLAISLAADAADSDTLVRRDIVASRGHVARASHMSGGRVGVKRQPVAHARPARVVAAMFHPWFNARGARRSHDAADLSGPLVRAHLQVPRVRSSGARRVARGDAAAATVHTHGRVA
ncbi:MAG: polyketide synthase dehydratase domain-containing protein [Planctomycetaceae bacterium]|nr:polyketide synthase dehydratase domain-containing protein [Planctomycetaceae bacterium]